MTVSEPVRHPGRRPALARDRRRGVGRLSDEFKTLTPRWRGRDLVGMWKILAHGYFHVDDDVLWVAVERDVPLLLSAMKAALATED